MVAAAVAAVAALDADVKVHTAHFNNGKGGAPT